MILWTLLVAAVGWMVIDFAKPEDPTALIGLCCAGWSVGLLLHLWDRGALRGYNVAAAGLALIVAIATRQVPEEHKAPVGLIAVALLGVGLLMVIYANQKKVKKEP